MKHTFRVDIIWFSTVIITALLSIIGADDKHESQSTDLVLKMKWEKIRTRLPTSPEKICETIILRIPGVCYAFNLGFGHLFGVAAGMWAQEICNSASGYGAMGFGAKRRRRDAVDQSRSMGMSFRAEEIQQFYEDLNRSKGSVTANESFAMTRHKRGWFGDGTNKWCLKTIIGMSRACKKLFPKAVSNHLRDFAWLCLFAWFDNTGICGVFVKSVGDICRATLSEPEGQASTPVAEMVPTPPSPTPLDPEDDDPVSVTSLPLSPKETCQSMAPSLFGLCKYFRGPARFFGKVPVAGIILKIFAGLCDAWYDGLANVIKLPRYYVEEVHSGNGTFDGGIDDGAHRSKRGLKEVGQKLWRHSRNFFVRFAHIQKDIYKAFATGVRRAGTAMCSAMVTKIAPICQKILGERAKKLWNYRSTCFLAGYFSGPCLVLMIGISGVCAADTRKCDNNLRPTAFSCTGKPNGYYADPKYSCAAYYFRCRSGKAKVRTCFEGPRYMFDESAKNCVKKSSNKECKDVLSPCLPEKKRSLKILPFEGMDVTCDPSLSPTTGALVSKQHKSSSLFELMHRTRRGVMDNLHNPSVSSKSPSSTDQSETLRSVNSRHSGFLNHISDRHSSTDQQHPPKSDDQEDSSGGYLRALGNILNKPKQQATTVVDEDDEKQEYLTDPDNYLTVDHKSDDFFICPKKHGYFPKSANKTCSRHFIQCTGGHPEEFTCSLLDHVFLNRTSPCVPRRHVPQCALPPCAANDRLRFDCLRTTSLLEGAIFLENGDYTFGCQDHPNGIYGDPYKKCVDYFFVCDRRKSMRASKVHCDVLQEGFDYVFDDVKLQCAERESVKKCAAAKAC